MFAILIHSAGDIYKTLKTKIHVDNTKQSIELISIDIQSFQNKLPRGEIFHIRIH